MNGYRIGSDVRPEHHTLSRSLFYANPMWNAKNENKYQNIFHFTTGANVLNCFSHQQCHWAERLWRSSTFTTRTECDFLNLSSKWRHAEAQQANKQASKQKEPETKRNWTRLAPFMCCEKIENNNEWYSLVFQVSPAHIGAHRCSRDLLSKV